MSATAAERVKAARLRKLARPLSAQESAWLADYERAHPRARAAVQASPEAPEAAAPPPSSQAESEWRVIDFGAAPESPGTELAVASETHEGATCPIPDCPSCRKAQGGMICATTGDRIWPKMSEEGAKGLASSILGIAAIIARMFGRDVVPQKAEIESLARAVRESAYRRASWAGASDDLFALAFCLGAFGMRVMNAPRLATTPPRPAP